MFNTPIIVDDCLPLSMVDAIEKTLFSTAFPWYFMPDLAGNSSIKDSISPPTSGFNHQFSLDDKITSNYYNLFCHIPNIVFNTVGVEKFPVIVNSRSFLHMPNKGKTSEHDGKHIDRDHQHYVCLYYVNDSDGDTHIWGYNANDDLQLKVTPKRGRAVLFDGMIYHASSSPRENPRAIINFDVIFNE
jgi:hypothetical protein